MISYKKLRMLLAGENIKPTNMCKAIGLSTNIVTKINNDQSITMDSIDKICCYLSEVLDRKIDVGDIVEIK